MSGTPIAWYVKSIEVDGLGGRSETYQQSLNPDVNVFFGLNGSGKTTLLKIIHAALNGEISPLIGAPFTRATVKIEIPEDGATIERSIVVPDSEALSADFRRALPASIRNRRGASPRYESLLKEVFDWETSVFAQDRKARGFYSNQPPGGVHSFRHRYLPTSRLIDMREMQTPVGPEWSFDEYFADSIQRLWASYSTEVLTGVRKAQEDGLGRILTGVISPSEVSHPAKELDPNQAYLRVASFLKRRKTERLVQSEDEFLRRFSSDSAFKRVVIDINEVEEQIELALEPRTKLEKLVQGLISGPKQIDFGDTQIRVIAADSREISLDRLSSGEKQLIRILVETLAARGRPIIIDEPELSMHIDWQNVLIESIQTMDSTAQVITATHSPEIMAEIDDEKIFRL
ncbi:AAA family ATPase [Kitasatospora sp. NPDC088264]|uniref:AAA family ATPase n=1 Tax=Kitasatospora sp. NPDC088264 TaxID=3155296 RepID=UPI00344466E8